MYWTLYNCQHSFYKICLALLYQLTGIAWIYFAIPGCFPGWLCIQSHKRVYSVDHQALNLYFLCHVGVPEDFGTEVLRNVLLYFQYINVSFIIKMIYLLVNEISFTTVCYVYSKGDSRPKKEPHVPYTYVYVMQLRLNECCVFETLHATRWWEYFSP